MPLDRLAEPAGASIGGPVLVPATSIERMGEAG
jgi:hypothetical protein